MYKIYKIRNNVNNKEYVGQTTQDIRRRFSQHMTTTSCCRILKDAVEEFGKESFEIELIDTAETKQEARIKEGNLIEQYETIHPGGYNLLSSGSCSRHSEITKQKMSETRKGKHPHWATEASRSPDAKAKRAESHRGQKRSKETIAKMKETQGKRCRAIKGQNGKTYRSTGDAAKELSLSRGNICMVLSGQRKTTGGFTFEYVQ